MISYMVFYKVRSEALHPTSELSCFMKICTSIILNIAKLHKVLSILYGLLRSAVKIEKATGTLKRFQSLKGIPQTVLSSV